MSLVPVVGPALEPVSLAEAKAHLRVDGSAEDVLIASLITAARVHLELITQSAFITQSWSYFLDAWPRRTRIDLPLGPARSVTRVRVLTFGNVAVTLDPAAYLLVGRSRPPRLVHIDRIPWSRGAPAPAHDADGIEIEYVAGFGDTPADVPQPLRHAMLLLVAHWYDGRSPVEVGQDAPDVPRPVGNLIAPYRVVRL